MSQVDWAVQMITRYRTEKNVEKTGVRRLHYWIISQPKEERMIPTRGRGKFRPFLPKDYNRLSELLVDARIDGLIPFDWIVDEKNEPLIEMLWREVISAEMNYDVRDVGYISQILKGRKFQIGEIS